MTDVDLEDRPTVTAGDAEVSLLGAVMAGFPDVGELLDTVEAADFYQPLHEQIWVAIRRVHEAGNQPDPVSVRLALSQSEVKHDPLRLLEMTQLVPTVSAAGYYARQVVDASVRRRIQAAAVRLHGLAASYSADVDDLRETARQTVDEATRDRTHTAARSLAEILPNVLDVAQNGRARVLGTGWPDIDRLVGGLAPGRLVVIGARPGVGKSLMGTNLALHFAGHHGHAVLFASIEMSEEEVMQRMLAKHAAVNLTRLMQGQTDDPEWDRIAKCINEINAMPCRVIDSAEQTVTSIRREARNFQRSRDDLALIVVDYLQLMRGSSHSSNRVEQLGEISRGLKLLARETGACVVAMAQVNRQSTSRTDGKPRSSDLRESGSIEADADQVILLHQPDEAIPELEVIVDKNRHGPKGIASLEVHGHYARLASVAWVPNRKAVTQ